tara:strand:+ start:3659 stop:4057 length:399 start_codon:yes stop_codon:yes gene_type:complete
MLPSDFSPGLMERAQNILKSYNETYPSERNRKLFPEIVQAVQFCSAWDISTEEILEAISNSKHHPFWSEALAQGSLTGFLKPRHIESVRHYRPKAEDSRNVRRMEAQDEHHKERQRRKGFDSNGTPVLRVAV